MTNATHPEDRCECGKPASHLTAHEDSAEWGCRVPIGIKDGRRIYTLTELSDQPATHTAHRPRETDMNGTAQAHPAWCDQAEHARVQLEHDGPMPECIGRQYVVTLSGQEYGSYWRQQSNGDRRATEWPGLHFAVLSPKDVRAWYRVLLHFGGGGDVDQVATMLGDALDEYHGGDAWRDQA